MNQIKIAILILFSNLHTYSFSHLMHVAMHLHSISIWWARRIDYQTIWRWNAKRTPKKWNREKGNWKKKIQLNIEQNALIAYNTETGAKPEFELKCGFEYKPWIYSLIHFSFWVMEKIPKEVLKATSAGGFVLILIPWRNELEIRWA